MGTGSFPGVNCGRGVMLTTNPLLVLRSWKSRGILIKIQSDATVCRYLFTAKLLYMFRVSQHPSSEALKPVTAASGTGHNIGTATSLQRGQVGRLRLQFLVLLMMGAVTPETCRVTLQ